MDELRELTAKARISAETSKPTDTAAGFQAAMAIADYCAALVIYHEKYIRNLTRIDSIDAYAIKSESFFKSVDLRGMRAVVMAAILPW